MRIDGLAISLPPGLGLAQAAHLLTEESIMLEWGQPGGIELFPIALSLLPIAGAGIKGGPTKPYPIGPLENVNMAKLTLHAPVGVTLYLFDSKEPNALRWLRRAEPV